MGEGIFFKYNGDQNMARITVEDCLQRIPNRFELVAVAAKRARQLEMEGEIATLPWENDKPTVLALREIAAGNIDSRILENNPNRKPATTNSDNDGAGETGEAA